jgi:predicted outer membrane protein
MVLVAGLSLFSLPVSAQTGAAQPAAAQARPTGPDQELVGQLRQLGQDQIVTANVAEKHAVSPRVNAFAMTIRRDHRMATERLDAYAERKNMNMDAIVRPGNAMPRGTISNAQLAGSPPDEFDYRFMSRMVADHQAAIDAAAAAQRLARDPELKGLIGTELVMMADHQVAAQELLAQIPAPTPPRVLQLPAYPAGVSRTQTGADVPPPEAMQQLAR